MSQDFEYDAFVSYAWDPDKALAPYLVRAVHGFARPWYRRRSLQLFLDVDGLTTEEAWVGIQRALERSRRLILLASPGVTRSESVARELTYWRSLERPPPIVVVTEGEVRWSSAAGDFDWEKTTALPRCVSGMFREEPLRLDARETRRSLSARNPQIRQIAAVIFASLSGRKLEDVIGEDVRVHRWNLAAAATAVTLVTGAAGAAIYFQWQRSIEERLVAAHRLQAESDLLESLQRAQLPNATLASAEAYQAFFALGLRPIEAEQALRDRLQRLPKTQFLGRTFWRPAVAAAITTGEEVYIGTESADGCRSDGSTSTSCDGELCLVPSAAAAPICAKAGFPVRTIISSTGGRLWWGDHARFCVGQVAGDGKLPVGSCGSLPDDVVQVIANGDKTFVALTEKRLCAISGAQQEKPQCSILPEGQGGVRLSPTGRVMAALQDGKICTYTLGPPAVQLPPPVCVIRGVIDDIQAVDDDGRWVLARSNDKRVLRRIDLENPWGDSWSVSLPAVIRHIIVSQPAALVGVVSGDMKSADYRATVVQLGSGQVLATMSQQGRITGITFARDGKRLLTSSGDIFPSDHTASLWDALSGKELSRLVHAEDVSVSAFAGPTQDRIVTATSSGNVARWEIDQSNGDTTTLLGERIRLDAIGVTGDFAVAGSSRACLRAAQDAKTACWKADEPDVLSVPAPGRIAFISKSRLCQALIGQSEVRCTNLGDSVLAGLSTTSTKIATVSSKGLCVSMFNADGSATELWCRALGKPRPVKAVSADGSVVALEGDEADSRELFFSDKRRRPIYVTRPKEGINVEAFDAAGTHYAHANDGVSDGSTVEVIPLGNDHPIWSKHLPARVTSLAFDARGQTLATGTGTGRGETQLWDWARDLELTRLAHARPVTAIGFGVSNEIVFIGSHAPAEFEATGQRWPIDPRRLLEMSCARLAPLVAASSPTLDTKRFGESGLASKCRSTSGRDS